MPWSQQGVDYGLGLRSLARPMEPPLVRERIRTAVRFFGVRMPGLAEEKILGFLKGMDLSCEVRTTDLCPGERLASYRDWGRPREPLFYARPGTSAFDLGVNPANRVFSRYVVRRKVDALECRTTGVVDAWTVVHAPFVANGGGMQVIVPHAGHYLKYVGVWPG